MVANRIATIVLGPEYDDRLKLVLRDVLGSMGGQLASKTPWLPDLEVVVVEMRGETITIEAETYMGLSISGPEALVQAVAQRVKARMI